MLFPGFPGFFPGFFLILYFPGFPGSPGSLRTLIKIKIGMPTHVSGGHSSEVGGLM